MDKTWGTFSGDICKNMPGTLNNQVLMDGNGDFQASFGIIQLKQPFINGCFGFQV